MKRLFVAVEVQLSPSNTQLLTQLKQELCLDNVVWVENKLHHLTLRFLGQTPETLIPPLKESISVVASQTDSFSLYVDKLGVFGSKHSPEIIWLGFEKFELFHQLFLQLESHLLEIGFDPNHGNFVPHITLGRIKTIQNKKRFWQLINQLQPIEKQELKIDSLLLIRSILTSQGPIYKTLQRFPFRKS